MTFIRFLTVTLFALLATAQAVAAQSRVALVIGNSAYVHSTPLTNPANDANDMAAALKSVGFEVVLGVDMDKRSFDGKVRDFARSLEKADVALLFYAGHGLQIGGRNFLVPTDAKLGSERDLDFEAVNVDFVLRQMELDRDNKTNVVILDACRDNPMARNLARSMGTRSASVGQGLAQVHTGVGTFIAYSTQPGNVALDGTGRNSPFTAALAKRLVEPGRNLTSIMIDVRKDVLTSTGGKQVPWDHSALTGEFYFNLASAPGMAPKAGLNEPVNDSMQRRLKELEDQIKAKADPEHTAKTVELAQARERVRQLEESNRSDQKQIFDMQYKTARQNDAQERANVSLELGAIQMRMVRRNQEIKTLRQRIATLETELGLPVKPPPVAAK